MVLRVADKKVFIIFANFIAPNLIVELYFRYPSLYSWLDIDFCQFRISQHIFKSLMKGNNDFKKLLHNFASSCGTGSFTSVNGNTKDCFDSNDQWKVSEDDLRNGSLAYIIATGKLNVFAVTI